MISETFFRFSNMKLVLLTLVIGIGTRSTCGKKTDKSTYNAFMVRLRDDLQKKGVTSRLEYAGSRFKGTEIDHSDYDNMFVKRDKSIKAEESMYSNYYYLSSDRVKVNRQETLEMFKEQLEETLRNIGASGYTEIEDMYGPTVVLRYHKPGDTPFQVDMVYALEVDDAIYVAKMPYGVGSDGMNLWYQTGVLKEKNKMKTIDKGNGVGKWAVRRLKGLKDQESDLKPISSYCFEQALMYVKDELKDPTFWRENNMEGVLRALLLFMEDAVRKGELLAYHDRSNNTLKNLTAPQKEQIANRFKNLAKKPKVVMDKTNGY